MIRVFFKYIVYIVLFSYMMIVFLPKTNVYYLGLDFLKPYKVFIVSENIKDNSLSLDIENLKVKYEGIEVAQIESLSVGTYLYRTTLEIDAIKANDVLKNFIPEYVQKISITHNVFKNPFKIDINARFKQGRAFGEVDLLERKVMISLDVSRNFISKYRDILKNLKKNGKYYTYEYQY